MNELTTTQSNVATRNEHWRRLLRRVDEVVTTPRIELLAPSPLDSQLPELVRGIETYLQPVSLDEATQALWQVVKLMGCKAPDPPTVEGYVMVMVQYPGTCCSAR